MKTSHDVTVLSGIAFAAILTMLATRAPASPTPTCSVSAIASLAKPEVAVSTAEPITNAGATYCRVRGTVATNGEGAGPGAAGFELDLPTRWNHKLVFLGGAGFDGALPDPAIPMLARGYVTLGTDSGHVGGAQFVSPVFDATWARDASGKRADAAIADFAYRARGQVNTSVRPLVSRFYDGRIRHAYFMGCSGGGREALIEAQRHPDMFDGFIAGAPGVSPRAQLAVARNFKVFEHTPIPADKLVALDHEMLQQCDAADGVVDGLIQNPAICSFDMHKLVSRGILSPAEATSLERYMSAVRDTRGNFVIQAGAITDLGDRSYTVPGILGGATGLLTYQTPATPSGAPSPRGDDLRGPVSWLVAHGLLADLAFNDPALDILGNRIFDARGAILPSAVHVVDHQLRSGLVDPSQMAEFFATDHKLIIFQGLSDPVNDPYSAVAMYRELTHSAGGADVARDSARLFMVPGMQHCHGGSGPNAFDPLAAMESWVEQGIAPDALLAAKFPDEDRSKPPVRTMPLCPFPAMARYDGKGDVTQASSWRCTAGDRGLEQIGPAGILAGFDHTLARD